MAVPNPQSFSSEYLISIPWQSPIGHVSPFLFHAFRLNLFSSFPSVLLCCVFLVFIRCRPPQYHFTGNVHERLYIHRTFALIQSKSSPACSFHINSMGGVMLDGKRSLINSSLGDIFRCFISHSPGHSLGNGVHDSMSCWNCSFPPL